MKKPDAVTVIPRESFERIVWPLAASEMIGIGSATKAKLDRYGITTLGKLAAMTEDFMKQILGKAGLYIWHCARGEDTTPVLNADVKIKPKSIGHRTTTSEDLTTNEEVWKVMLELTQSIGSDLRAFDLKATGISIAIRDNTLFSRQW